MGYPIFLKQLTSWPKIIILPLLVLVLALILINLDGRSVIPQPNPITQVSPTPTPSIPIPSPTPTLTPTPTPEPKDLDVTIRNNISALQITNHENVEWQNCYIKLNSGGLLNSGYEYHFGTLFVNDIIGIPWSSFVKGDQRFNYSTTQPKTIFISCQSASGQYASVFFSTDQ